MKYFSLACQTKPPEDLNRQNLFLLFAVLLPYTEAVILEIQRCASLVPLGVPHRNREDITVNGFTIPKGTLISANLFSIHRDARWWKNPEKFDPNRFLDENMKLTRPDGFMPFSTGKR
jgi:long-chain fatty acid omega-monooxygenase